MKSNKLAIFKLFVIHIIVYYVVFTIVSVIIWDIAKGTSFFSKEDIKKIIVSPILGITGMYDGYCLFLIPHVFLLLLFIKKFKMNMMKGFIISSLIVYLIIYINYKLLFFKSFFFNVHFFEKYSGYNILPAMIISLLTSFFFNWLFIRKRKSEFKNL